MSYDPNSLPIGGDDANELWNTARDSGLSEEIAERWAAAGITRRVVISEGTPRFQPELVDRTRREMYDGLVEASLAEEQ
jgi:hypothetical protein